MRSMKRILILLLACSVCLLSVPGAFAARVYGATEIPKNLSASVDGGEGACVKAIQLEYANNYYISLRDMAALLSGTQKDFGLSVAGDSLSVRTADSYEKTGRENLGWAESGQAAGGHTLSYHGLTVDDREKKYYSIIVSAEDSASDAYMSVIDFAMMLDINITSENADELSVDTTRPFCADPLRLEKNGYFQDVNSVLVGNVTTGELYYGYHAKQEYPIASTTKLMTYLLVREALESGAISMEDEPVISKSAALLSQNGDRVIPLTEGRSATMSDLLRGMLIASSNECALVLAEHVAGDEAAFVGKMNEKAAALGMETTQFYNCNGLPSFADAAAPAKRSNHMSAEDMFRLCSYILNTYPQITEITSQKSGELFSLEADVKNTNGVLYNMPEVNGLKTGTTTKAGACLVTSLRVEDQDIVAILFGAENAQDRVRISEMMDRYGKNVVLGVEKSTGYGEEAPVREAEEGPAKDAAGIIRQVVRCMKEKED